MFEAFGGERWWPLNSQTIVVRETPDRVLEALDPWRRPEVRGRYPDLEAAVAAHGPFPLSREDTRFVVGTADGSAVLLGSDSPSTGWAGSTLEFLSVGRELHCDGIGVQWRPRHRHGLADAGFVDYHHTPRRAPAPGPFSGDVLSVQVSDQGGRWVFERVPPGADHAPRDYEELDAYRARITADRLPLALLRRYLVALGIPVDDPGYLTGPVLTVSRATRIASDRTWSTMAELRRHAGYPAEGVPADLRIRPDLDTLDASDAPSAG